MKSRCDSTDPCLDAYSVKTMYNDEIELQNHENVNEIGAVPLKEWIEFIESITMEDEELRTFCELEESKFNQLKLLWKMVL